MMTEKKPLIIITGPTAVGKTDLSIQIAKAVNGEIISADSMQVYRHMDIGTAKIRPEEMQNVPHHLIDCLEPFEEFNIYLFQKMALRAIDDILSRGKLPIIVGGTGFYIQSVLKGVDFSDEEKNTAYREHLQKIADEQGAQALHDMLLKTDPAAAEKIHANNIKRVIRALEYYEQTGRKISEHNETEREKEPVFDALYFVVNTERDVLYERIEKRIDMMLADGLVEEVKKLREMGCTRDMVSMKGLGYKEILAYLDGEIPLEEAVYIIKRDTRHFAKRQITWFKREKDVIWMNYPDFDNKKERMQEAMLGKIGEHYGKDVSTAWN